MKTKTRLTGVAFEAQVAGMRPRAALSPWIAKTYLSGVPDGCLQSFSARRLPEAGTQLVLSGDITSRGNLENARIFVRGPLTRLTHVDAPSQQTAQILVVELQPGCARALLGVAGSVLCDLEIDLAELWGSRARTLLSQLAEAHTATKRLGLIEDALVRRLAQAKSSALPVSTVAHRLIANAQGRLPIATLTDSLGVGDRLLHRRFIDEVGLSPKYCARIMRLQEVVRTSLEPRCWAEAAGALGYSDQAHLIGDFRQFMGSAPGRFFAGEDFVPALLNLGWMFTPVSEISKTPAAGEG